MRHLNGTTTVITPAGTGSTWAEVWAYREVLYFMVWRDLRVHSILEGTNQVMRMIVSRELTRQ